VQRRLITRCIEDVIATSEAAITTAGVGSVEEVRAAGRTLIRFSPEIAEAEQGLKRYLFDHVYRNEAVMAPVRHSQEVVGGLFDHYLATLDMPGRWGRRAKGTAEEAGRARVVCDFIAGMTDPYALEQHARLFDGRPQVG
jgi:dGTPase